MKFQFTPRPSPSPSTTRAAVAPTPHKRIVAPAFDDDSDSSSGSLPSSSPLPQRTPPTAAPSHSAADARRIKNALFADSTDAWPMDEDGGGRGDPSVQAPESLAPYSWRHPVVGGKDLDDSVGDVGDAAASAYEMRWRAPVAPRRSLPRPVLERCSAKTYAAKFRARGWRGSVVDGGEAVCLPDGVDVSVRGVRYGKRALGRGAFVKALRLHAVAWINSRDENSIAKGEAQVPALKQAFSEGSGVADAVVARICDDDFAAAGEEDVGARHAAVVFKLLGALYQTEGVGGKNNMLSRVVDWARGDASVICDDPVDQRSTGLKKALMLLTVGDIEGAMTAAIEDGYLRLGMLISRAAESDKQTLRADAAAQLEAYGGPGEDVAEQSGDGDHVMGGADPGTHAGLVSPEERMILCLLAGNIAVVARRLRLSWYRVFSMELLYGAGSAAEPLHSERVSAAVGAMVALSDIPALPPHGDKRYRDAAYHLLRLYADPTGSYPLNSGIFSASSFGLVENPVDYRFPWHLQQCLSGLVPKVVVEDAMHLSESFSAQLLSAGLPLWAFYVLCSGRPAAAVVKASLIQTWPMMATDQIELPVEFCEGTGATELELDAELREKYGSATGEGDNIGETMGPFAFLVGVMKVPVGWIHEARAIHFRVEGDEVSECENWLQAGTLDGLSRAESLITNTLFPRAVAEYDAAMLKRILAWLDTLNQSTRLPNWSASGGLLRDYLCHIAPETMKLAGGQNAAAYAACLPVYKSMAERVGLFAERARSPLQRHAATVVADGIASATRVAALHNPSLVEDAMDDLERMGPHISPATTRRLVAEYKHQCADGGLAGAALFVSALPVYSALVGRARPLSVDFSKPS